MILCRNSIKYNNITDFQSWFSYAFFLTICHVLIKYCSFNYYFIIIICFSKLVSNYFCIFFCLSIMVINNEMSYNTQKMVLHTNATSKVSYQPTHLCSLVKTCRHKTKGFPDWFLVFAAKPPFLYDVAQMMKMVAFSLSFN